MKRKKIFILLFIIIIAIAAIGSQKIEANEKNEKIQKKEITLKQKKIKKKRKKIQENKIDLDKPMIALTYDDGPYSEVTDRILNVLEKNGAKATFFVVGNRVKTYKKSVKYADKIGCEIGNHTYAHTNLSSLSNLSIKKAIEQTNREVSKVIGISPSLLRPTGGNYTSRVQESVDMPMILWSIDTEDWKYRNKAHVEKEIIGKVKDGDIILMHDLYSSTAEASEVIIPQLVKEGYQLVTVSELLKYKGINPEKGKIYRKIS